VVRPLFDVVLIASTGEVWPLAGSERETSARCNGSTSLVRAGSSRRHLLRTWGRPKPSGRSWPSFYRRTRGGV